MLMYHISHSDLKSHWEIEFLFDLEFLLCNFYQLRYYKFYMNFKKLDSFDKSAKSFKHRTVTELIFSGIFKRITCIEF